MMAIHIKHKHRREKEAEGYDTVRELFEDNYHEPPQYESSVSDGTTEEAEG